MSCATAGTVVEAQRQPTFVPKCRRQSLHLSGRRGAEDGIPWNKSFDDGSCVRQAAGSGLIERAKEQPRNRARRLGNIEAIRGPYRRPDPDTGHEDVMFLWWEQVTRKPKGSSIFEGCNSYNIIDSGFSRV